MVTAGSHGTCVPDGQTAQGQEQPHHAHCANMGDPDLSTSCPAPPWEGALLQLPEDKTAICHHHGNLGHCLLQQILKYKLLAAFRPFANQPPQ